jgi:uncharacterized membrane protein
MTYLGGAAGLGNEHYALVCGPILLLTFAASATYLWLTAREQIRQAAAWFGLAAYAFLSACLAGVARLDLGVQQAASSRYTTISVLLLISTAVLALMALEQLYARRPDLDRFVVAASALGLVLLIASTAGGYAKGLRSSAELKQNLIATGPCIHAATDSSPDCLLKAYPNKQIVWERIEYLRSIHWGGF